MVGRRVRDGPVPPPTPLSVELVREEVGLGDGLAPLRIERPASSEALIDEGRFDAEDEFLPYWAELWPSAVVLAAWAARAPLAGARVLELGCGLALPAVAAARAGADVVATDWAPEAVAAARRNAHLTGTELTAVTADWRRPEPLVARGPFDVVLAADVLYEARHTAPLLALLDALRAPRVVLADPSRATAEAFLAAAHATHDLTATAQGDRPALRLYDLCRRGDA